MKNNLLHAFKYIALDILSASGAWLLFMYYRLVYLENIVFEIKSDYIINGFFISLCWVSFYALIGNYNDIYRKSRLKEITQIFLVTLIGVTIIFFAVLIDDFIVNYKHYYSSFFALFCFHFIITSLLRFLLTTRTAVRIHNKVIGFNTLIIGSNEKAETLFKDLENEQKSSGHTIVGFLHVENKKHHLLDQYTSNLGSFEKAKEIIQEKGIEDIIIAIESSEHHKIEHIINELENTGVYVKIIPDMYDILSGSVKMNSILGTPLIEIKHKLLPQWEFVIKRFIDYLFSLTAILLFSPVLILTAIAVKLSSSGPIIFKQERIGQYGQKFNIYKFRSMYEDAEKEGPQLSSKTDPRITPFGLIMRRIRLDETLQFFNVLFGHMSFVGPRPERDFFANQIIEKAPHYKHIYRVKPGITSWGMVKYGYAENVDEMLERLKYDILYIENMSLLIDLKIMIHTVLIILQGRGK
jgi:exopolysaccharide biosynthesis polyprenyl glycosylphosphotransferase